MSLCIGDRFTSYVDLQKAIKNMELETNTIFICQESKETNIQDLKDTIVYDHLLFVCRHGRRRKLEGKEEERQPQTGCSAKVQVNLKEECQMRSLVITLVDLVHDTHNPSQEAQVSTQTIGQTMGVEKNITENDHPVTIIMQDEQEATHNISYQQSIAVAWNKASTLKLIQLHKEHQYLFDDPHYKKKSVWQMIVMCMKKEGYDYTLKQVENKWKSLTKKYRDAVDHNARKDIFLLRRCAFFNELSLVYDYRPQLPANRETSSGLITGDITEVTNISDVSGELDNVHQKIVAAVSLASHPPLGIKRSVDDMSQQPNSSMILKKKKKYDQPSGEQVNAANPNEVLHMLHTINEDRKRMERQRMERLEKMHEEKVGLFKELIAVLKKKSVKRCRCVCANTNLSSNTKS